MATSRRDIQIDWLTLGLYAFFMVFGWLNIYSASTNDASLDLFNLDFNYGKQFIFLCVCVVIGIALIQFIDYRDIEFTSYIFYGLVLVALVAVMLLARNVAGARSWFDLGPFKFQPSEFAKLATALALARYMSEHHFSWKNLRDRLVVFSLIGVPVVLILLQNDTGTALVFAGLLLMLFREGLSGIWLVLGTLILGFGIMALLVDVFTVVNLLVLIAFAVYIRQTRNKRWNTHLLVLLVLDLLFLSVLIGNTFDFEVFGLVFTDRSLLLMLDVLLLGFFVFYLARFRNRRWTIYAFILAAFVAYVSGIDAVYQYVLKDHQRARITALFDPDYDPRGINWNSTQSKIAIGSGGIIGKGYLQGTQTKFDFVPQQHTDFIFCTIGEEWGWLGTTILIAAFFLFLSQILYMAEECKSKFGRILGYSVAGMFFVHIAINIAMTVGLAPVIGIPLPFFSYGGSALISFTAMYFLVLKYYSVRGKMLRSSL